MWLRTIHTHHFCYSVLLLLKQPGCCAGTSILRALDDTQMLLDDQIVKTQSMRASPYIGPFEDRVRMWEMRLGQAQDTLDAWLACQQGWLYLEPIFGSEDIMQQASMRSCCSFCNIQLL